ncbi:Glycoside hydrolase family 16 [Dillenia turbinata]|uniref:Glycoside hydrolase family 16 n=1 Tax=Dillenia turbinata TaxID=194707 RepID=A0AAN8V668_9MAGN
MQVSSVLITIMYRILLSIRVKTTLKSSGFEVACANWFLVDNIQIREVLHNTATSSLYPSKPISVYTTIWDGSDWATHGAVNYQYAPFVASLGEVEMSGCIVDEKDSSNAWSKDHLSSLDPVESDELTKLSLQQMLGMQWSRHKLVFYSY